jgi:hypothetical protein
MMQNMMGGSTPQPRRDRPLRSSCTAQGSPQSERCCGLRSARSARFHVPKGNPVVPFFWGWPPEIKGRSKPIGGSQYVRDANAKN